MIKFKTKRNDTAKLLEATLYYPATTPVNLTTASTIRFKMADSTGALKVNRVVPAADAAAGRVDVAWQAADVDTAGVFRAEFEVTWGDATLQTFPEDGFIRVQISEDL